MQYELYQLRAAAASIEVDVLKTVQDHTVKGVSTDATIMQLGSQIRALSSILQDLCHSLDKGDRP